MATKEEPADEYGTSDIKRKQQFVDKDERRSNERRSANEYGSRDRKRARQFVDKDERRSNERRSANEYTSRGRRSEPHFMDKNERRSTKEYGTSDEKRKLPVENNEEREKPSFEPSGKLAQETNTFKGVVIKYNEPPDAKIPKMRWRMYPFKGEENLPVIYLHRQSAYLIGRDRKIADFPVDHPSCSKQHAALQYRSIQYERADGSKGRRTRPYIIDLASGNGTYLNGERIDPQRYYELKEKDVLRFGFSSREYVMLHEHSLQDDESDTSEDGSENDDEADAIIDRTEAANERLAKAEEDDLF